MRQSMIVLFVACLSLCGLRAESAEAMNDGKQWYDVRIAASRAAGFIDIVGEAGGEPLYTFPVEAIVSLRQAPDFQRQQATVRVPNTRLRFRDYNQHGRVVISTCYITLGMQRRDAVAQAITRARLVAVGK